MENKELEYVNSIRDICSEFNVDVCKHCTYNILKSCPLPDQERLNDALAKERTRIKRVKSKYENICESRKSPANKALQESLWNIINEQLDGFDIDEDCIPFTKSEESDRIMEVYEENLIKVLSGLDKKLPDWYGLDSNEEQ